MENTETQTPTEEVQAQGGTEVAPEPPNLEDMSIEEQAAHAIAFLNKALPGARSLVDKITGVQAKRVLTALLESPLEQTVPGFTTKEALRLFEIGCVIQNAKFILFKGAPSLLSEVEKQQAFEQTQKDIENEKNEENANEQTI